MVRHLDADGVDQDGTLEPGRPGDRHLGGDPAPNGVAEDGDADQVEIVEERGVELGQLSGRAQTVGTDGAGETRMGRGDDSGPLPFGEQVCETRDRKRTGPSVKYQIGIAVTALVELQLDSSDVRESDRVGRGHLFISPCFG